MSLYQDIKMSVWLNIGKNKNYYINITCVTNLISIFSFKLLSAMSLSFFLVIRNIYNTITLIIITIQKQY